MAIFKVTLTSMSGEVTSFNVNTTSVKEVTHMINQDYKDYNYVIEGISAPKGLPPEAMPALMNATGALIACILMLAVADYKLRKWLKS